MDAQDEPRLARDARSKDPKRVFKVCSEERNGRIVADRGSPSLFAPWDKPWKAPLGCKEASDAAPTGRAELC